MNVARVFTGWTFAPLGNREMLATVRGNVEGGDRRIPQLDFDGAYRFQFRPMLHDSGEKVVLGEDLFARRATGRGLPGAGHAREPPRRPRVTSPPSWRLDSSRMIRRKH